MYIRSWRILYICMSERLIKIVIIIIYVVFLSKLKSLKILNNFKAHYLII